MSWWTRDATRTAPAEQRGRSNEPTDAALDDWPESVRIVGLQPSLWSMEQPPPAPPPPARPGVVRLGPETLAVGGDGAEIALSREIGQSFYLMGLMALALFLFVGLGMLLVRVLA